MLLGAATAAARAPALRAVPASLGRRRNLLQPTGETAGAPSRQRRSGWAGEREGKAGGRRRRELVGRPGVAA